MLYENSPAGWFLPQPLRGTLDEILCVRIPAKWNTQIGQMERLSTGLGRSEATLDDQSFRVLVFFFRREGPLRSILWALCTIRSQMASAMVGSPR